MSISQCLIKNIFSPNFSSQLSEKINRNKKKAVLYDRLPKITRKDKQVLLVFLLFFYHFILPPSWCVSWAVGAASPSVPAPWRQEETRGCSPTPPAARSHVGICHSPRTSTAQSSWCANSWNHSYLPKKKQQHRNMSVGQRRLRSSLHPAYWQESAALIKREMCSESRFFFWFLVFLPIFFFLWAPLLFCILSPYVTLVAETLSFLKQQQTVWCCWICASSPQHPTWWPVQFSWAASKPAHKPKSFSILASGLLLHYAVP